MRLKVTVIQYNNPSSNVNDMDADVVHIWQPCGTGGISIYPEADGTYHIEHIDGGDLSHRIDEAGNIDVIPQPMGEEDGKEEE